MRLHRLPKMLFISVFYLFLILGAILMIGPLAWMFLTSFKFPAEVIQYPPTWFPKKPTLSNYVEVFSLMKVFRLFLNSSIVAIANTASVLFFSSLAGYTFAIYRSPGRDLIFLAILSSMMIPFQVIMIPLYLIIRSFGWLNTYQALIVPGMMSAFGIFLMRQFVTTIPMELIEAARIDGCPEFGIYWNLILPNLKPALSALGVFTFLWNWDNFLWPVVVTDSWKLFTLPVGLAMFTHQYFTEYNLVMAGSSMAVIPVLVVYFIAQKQIIRGITLTGLKG